MAEGRKGEVTFKGNPVTLAGRKLKAGDKAPDFTCVGAGLALVTLADTRGKARLFNVVPSLDTPVCNKQTKRFAEELKALGDKVAAYTVSLDLPFAQARFCTEANIDNLNNLSDARDKSFGQRYGPLDEAPADPPARPGRDRRRPLGHDPVCRDRARDRLRAELRAGPGGAKEGGWSLSAPPLGAHPAPGRGQGPGTIQILRYFT